ncbi:MAG: mannitol dehydrogenase family protein [Eggerthellaceae bacterium]|nr:mannitol dehydrogenase family protein [Eggerthellaceae bacterium]
MHLSSWKDRIDELEELGVVLPSDKSQTAREVGKKQPKWIHFGGGNLFRALHAQIAQDMIDAGDVDSGVVVGELLSDYILKKAFEPFNYDVLQVIMMPDGQLKESILSSVACGIWAHPESPDWQQAKAYFESPKLQLVSFSVTEKAYGVDEEHIIAGPEKTTYSMGIVTSLLLTRFRAGAAPIAMLSTDNFSKNGRVFREAVLQVAQIWEGAGFCDLDFFNWLSDESKVSFPWSMIDRIVPNPSEEVARKLKAQGWEDMQITKNPHGASTAGFANTEETWYLVVEDSFPNGRPPLEKAGVILGTRTTADKADTMKVTACLNPLHTSLAVYGMLLGYDRIWKEMEDPQLNALVRQLGYAENLPVVVDPEVIDPREFIDKLVEERLSNPAMPDTPQRISCDTSLKIPIRYGVTLKSYYDRLMDVDDLIAIPLCVAGWLRYLIAVDDKGKVFKPSSDPRLEEMQEYILGIELGESDMKKIHEAVEPILSDDELFGVDLYELGLGDKIELLLLEELAGIGAVRATLEKYLG